VSTLCILSEEDEPFGYTYLICDSLPGSDARSAFENGSDCLRKAILRGFGAAVALLHSLDRVPGPLPKRSLANWRDRIRLEVLENADVVESLPMDSQERIPAIAEILDALDIETGPIPQGFQWGDAALHNVLVARDGRITGLLDFENSAWGDLIDDQLFIDADFDIRTPRDLYRRPEYREEFWSSYERAGGRRVTPTERYRGIRKASQVTGLLWFWRALGMLPPWAPKAIEELQNALEELHEAQER
jgi:aminoglycoside phosphotransferase (APT) family kinase protein